MRIRPVLYVCLAFATPAATAQPVTLEALAIDQVTDSYGPGVEAGTVFTFFNVPSADNAGNAIFRAQVGGANVPPGATAGVWRFGPSGRLLAMRDQDLSPFDGAPLPLLFDGPKGGDGDIVGFTEIETLVHNGVSLQTLAHASMQAPSLAPGVLIGFMSLPASDRNGTYAFSSDVGAVFAGSVGGLSLLAQSGGAAPGAAGDTYAGFSNITMTEDGGLCVRASLTTANASALFTGTTGGISMHVMEGDAAPGMPGGATFEQLHASALGNASGLLAVKARTTLGGGVTADDDTGLWVGAPGALVLVAREGDQADGAPAGVLYGDMNDEFRPPVITSNGRIGLAVNLAGPGVGPANDLAIFAGMPGALTMVAREGDVAPGSGSMVFTFLSSYAMSESGHVVFGATISDGGPNNFALFAWHESTGLYRVAGTGDPVNFGVWGTWDIGSPEFAGYVFTNPPGERAVGLNPDGVLVFKVNLLIGNTGIVRTTLPGGIDPADLNGDGAVDGMDLAALLASWGVCPPPCPPDLNGDGAVDGMDLAALLAAWSP